MHFIADSSTQHDFQYNSASSQTYQETSVVECQTESNVQTARVQTDEKDVAELETQTTRIETADFSAQTKAKTKATVTQTIVQVVEAAVGTHIEMEDRGTQPEISMFRLEDLKSSDESTVSQFFAVFD